MYAHPLNRLPLSLTHLEVNVPKDHTVDLTYLTGILYYLILLLFYFDLIWCRTGRICLFWQEIPVNKPTRCS